MKNLTVLVVLMVFVLTLPAQSIERKVISSSGGVFTNLDLKIFFTVGELSPHYFSNSNLIVSQGFQQNNVNITSLVENNTNLEVSAYPNPTNDFLQIELESKDQIEITFEIMDIQGKRVIHSTPNFSFQGKGKTLIDVSELPNGSYLILLFNNAQKIGDLKIIKN